MYWKCINAYLLIIQDCLEQPKLKYDTSESTSVAFSAFCSKNSHSFWLPAVIAVHCATFRTEYGILKKIEYSRSHNRWAGNVTFISHGMDYNTYVSLKFIHFTYKRFAQLTQVSSWTSHLLCSVKVLKYVLVIVSLLCCIVPKFL